MSGRTVTPINYLTDCFRLQRKWFYFCAFLFFVLIIIGYTYMLATFLKPTLVRFFSLDLLILIWMALAMGNGIGSIVKSVQGKKSFFVYLTMLYLTLVYRFN